MFTNVDTTLALRSLPRISIPAVTPSIPIQGDDSGRLTPNGFSPSRSRGRNSNSSFKSSKADSVQVPGSRSSSKNSGDGNFLRDQLRDARVESPHRPHCFIVPISAQELLITATNIERDILARDHNISPAEAKHVAEKACLVARKLFAILAYMKKGLEICSLLNDGVSDYDLPLTRKCDDKGEFTLERDSGEPIETFKKWSKSNIEKFDRIQWWMIAPVFEVKEHYELDDSIILPFTPFKTNAEIEWKKEGGYSEVYAVRVHPSHHKFGELLEPEV